MLHIVKNTNLMIKRTSLLGGLLFAAILALVPTWAHAQCVKWDAGGVVTIIQQGQAFTIDLTLEQKDFVITGTANATGRAL